MNLEQGDRSIKFPAHSPWIAFKAVKLDGAEFWSFFHVAVSISHLCHLCALSKTAHQRGVQQSREGDWISLACHPSHLVHWPCPILGKERVLKRVAVVNKKSTNVFLKCCSTVCTSYATMEFGLGAVAVLLEYSCICSCKRYRWFFHSIFPVISYVNGANETSLDTVLHRLGISCVHRVANLQAPSVWNRLVFQKGRPDFFVVELCPWELLFHTFFDTFHVEHMFLFGIISNFRRYCYCVYVGS